MHHTFSVGSNMPLQISVSSGKRAMLIAGMTGGSMGVGLFATQVRAVAMTEAPGGASQSSYRQDVSMMGR